MVQKWLSVTKGDGLVRFMVYQTTVLEPSFMDKIFTTEEFYINHVWAGMMVRYEYFILCIAKLKPKVHTLFKER